jgi:hypothetical protein
MNAPVPPWFPTWLLQRFAVHESLIGDLIERYRRRSSPLWYWRQVIVTIAITALQALVSHKLLALRAFLTLWAVLWAVGLIPLGAPIWTVVVAWELTTRWRTLAAPSRLPSDHLSLKTV